MFHSIDFKGRKLSVITSAILLIICSKPYFFWWVSSSVILSVFCKILLCVIFYANKEDDSRNRTPALLFALSVVLLFVLQLVKGSANAFGLLSVMTNLALMVFFVSTGRFAQNVYQVFIRILGIIWLLSLLSLLTEPLQPVLGQIKHIQLDRFYNVFAFHVREISIDSMSHFRFSGIYEEPGDVGTLAAILLFIEKFNFKDRRNIIFLVAGLLSMSLFFYIIMASYLLLYVLTVKKKYGLALLIVAGLLSFYMLSKDNSYFYDLLWQRLELNEDGTGIVGDDRMTEAGDIYYEEKIRGTLNFWFGVNNPEEFMKYAMGGSSYKIIVATDGFVFLVIYILSFIILCYNYNKLTFPFILFSLFLLLNMYQRCNIYYPDYCFLYSIFAVFASRNVNEDISRIGPLNAVSCRDYS